MTGWVVQREVDGKFYTGLKSPEWMAYLSAARAFLGKSDAVQEMADRGFRVEAMRFLVLPTPKPRVPWIVFKK